MQLGLRDASGTSEPGKKAVTYTAIVNKKERRSLSCTRMKSEGKRGGGVIHPSRSILPPNRQKKGELWRKRGGRGSSRIYNRRGKIHLHATITKIVPSLSRKSKLGLFQRGREGGKGGGTPEKDSYPLSLEADSTRKKGRGSFPKSPGGRRKASRQESAEKKKERKKQGKA